MHYAKLDVLMILIVQIQLKNFEYMIQADLKLPAQFSGFYQ